MTKIAIVFTRLGPYHRIRIEAAAARSAGEGAELVTIETARTDRVNAWSAIECQDGVRRVTRLTNQMRFLARDAVVVSESFPLAPLIDEAYQEAQKYQPVKSAQLKYVAEITLADLQRLGAAEVDLVSLKQAGLVRQLIKTVKVIKSGELTIKVALKGIGATAGAKAAIEAAGGSLA